MSEVERPSQWFRDWTIWAALALNAALICFWWLQVEWHQPPQPRYVPWLDDPVNYSELMAQYAPPPSSISPEVRAIFYCLAFAGVLVLLSFIFGNTQHKRIVDPLLGLFGALIVFSCCLVAILVFVTLNDTTITIEDKDTVVFDSHRYHIAIMQENRLDMPNTVLMLFECDLDDTNCYGTDIYRVAPVQETIPFELVVNEDDDQLEVWVDGRLLYTK